MLERRFGPLPVVAIFVLCGAAGMAVVAYAETPPLFEDSGGFIAFGANGAALGLLCAWLVDDRRAARRGDERENDLLGVYVIAIVLVLLSVAEESANIGAAVGGAVTGALLGLALPLFTRKSAYDGRPSIQPVFTDEQVEAAVRALSDPERSAGAERARGAAGPAASARARARAREGGWFGDAHGSQVRSALSCTDDARARASASRPCSPRRRGWGCCRRGRRLGARP